MAPVPNTPDPISAHYGYPREGLVAASWSAGALPIFFRMLHVAADSPREANVNVQEERSNGQDLRRFRPGTVLGTV